MALLQAHPFFVYLCAARLITYSRSQRTGLVARYGVVESRFLAGAFRWFRGLNPILSAPGVRTVPGPMSCRYRRGSSFPFDSVRVPTTHLLATYGFLVLIDIP